MLSLIQFIRNRLAEALWVRPLLMCLFSFLGTVVAYVLGLWVKESLVPEISRESLQVLLGVLSSGMLAIAVFAVGAMVSAYSSASQTATPRAFSLIIADDVSQNALSTFVGAFLFSVISLLALLNGFYSGSGRFFLLVLTLVVFWVVVITFIRWVDRIARLGRMAMTLKKVEAATLRSIRSYQNSWLSHCGPCDPDPSGTPIRLPSIGYLQHVDWVGLQRWAEQHEARIQAELLPGAFMTPERVVAWIIGGEQDSWEEEDLARVQRAFRVGEQRYFDEDPRFGFVVLSEIASRALSPAVNDPGTAIQIIGYEVRLLEKWLHPEGEIETEPDKRYDRLCAPAVELGALFEDAFVGIARDGASTREVMIRLQKALRSLGQMDERLAEVADRHARQALKRAKLALTLDEDYDSVLSIYEREKR